MCGWEGGGESPLCVKWLRSLLCILSSHNACVTMWLVKSKSWRSWGEEKDGKNCNVACFVSVYEYKILIRKSPPIEALGHFNEQFNSDSWFSADKRNETKMVENTWKAFFQFRNSEKRHVERDEWATHDDRFELNVEFDSTETMSRGPKKGETFYSNWKIYSMSRRALRLCGTSSEVSSKKLYSWRRSTVAVAKKKVEQLAEPPRSQLKSH